MFKKGKSNFFLCARVILLAFSLFLIFTSAQSIQCTSSYPDEYLDFCVIHKSRIINPFQSVDAIVVHYFNLPKIQRLGDGALDIPDPESVMSEEVFTILRC